MCGHQNVRTTTGDNTGQNTKDTHPVPGLILKFLALPGIEPGLWVVRQDSTDHATSKDINSILIFVKIHVEAFSAGPWKKNYGRD